MIRSSHNFYRPGKALDAFRFPLLETWTARVVYGDARWGAAVAHLDGSEVPATVWRPRIARAADITDAQIDAQIEFLERAAIMEEGGAWDAPVELVEPPEEPEAIVAPSEPKTAPTVPSYAVCTFSGERDRYPKPAELTWPELVARMTTEPVVCEAKPGLLAWSPALYPDGATRARRNVVSVSCLVQDYDSGAHWDDILPSWEGHAAIVHTSHSHGVSGVPKWRLVLPLSAPVPAEAWQRVWSWASERSGGQDDPACKDPSRLYYVPAHHPERGDVFRAWAVEGSTVDVPADVLEPPKVPAWRRAEVKALAAKARSKHARSGDIYKVSREAREDAARGLGWRLDGDHAKGKCPECGQMTGRFWLPTGEQVGAYCTRDGCSWHAFLDTLVGGE